MSETIVGEKYRIHDLIGEGNMGAVYEAEHVHTGRRCALKVISSPELVDDAQVLGRFEREARAAGGIASRHIAQVIDAGVDSHTQLPFMVMEFLEGEDLHDLLGRLGPLPTALALRIVAQACLGLHRAHEAGVVHRDVKPHNLYLCLEDAGEVVVKLLDFGVAKIKMDQASTLAGANLTAPGSVLGSPRYMSPEQALGSPTIDRRTDIWSLGSVLYEALSGHSPFHEPKTLADLIVALTTKPPPPLRDAAPSVPTAVAEVVHRCLEREPEDRFPTAEALFDALGPFIDRNWSLHVDMLLELDEPASDGAGRAEADDDAASGAGLGEAASLTRTEPMERAPTAPALDETVAASPAVTRARPSAGTTRTDGGRRPPMVYALAVGVIAMIAAVGWAFTTGGGGGVAAPATTATPAAQPSDSGESSPSGGPSNPRQGVLRHVQVVILPSDAAVEVDGKRAEVQNSILALSGPLGAVYQVRVYQGDAETIADVVISNSGALPPKIELVPGQVVRMPGRGAEGVVTAQATALAPTGQPEVAASPPAPKEAKPTTLDSDMHEFE